MASERDRWERDKVASLEAIREAHEVRRRGGKTPLYVCGAVWRCVWRCVALCGAVWRCVV